MWPEDFAAAALEAIEPAVIGPHSPPPVQAAAAQEAALGELGEVPQEDLAAAPLAAIEPLAMSSHLPPLAQAAAALEAAQGELGEVSPCSCSGRAKNCPAIEQEDLAAAQLAAVPLAAIAPQLRSSNRPRSR